MISLKKSSMQLPFMWPVVIAWSAQWQPERGRERESRMRKTMDELLSSDCVWNMCGCCWLKVVVVIAGLKMPGGGCVLLIPYLISRSRGEALNPKHTHKRLLIVGANTYTLCSSPTQAPTTSMHMCPFTCLFTVRLQSSEIHRKVFTYFQMFETLYIIRCWKCGATCTLHASTW